MAERLAERQGDAQVYLNHVRLDKRGLLDVAAKALSFPNARLSAQRQATELVALHHYLRCNFKATFLSDEKQEQIISVVLDVQGGHVVRSADLLERLVSYETESAFPHLTVAQPRWRGAGEALGPATLEALVQRGRSAAEVALAERLAGLQARSQRFLELDGARIEDYYGALERDLKQRLARVEAGDAERRRSIESKIEALRAEHQAKLADIRARHQLRVELELINVLITAQPKVVLPVEVGNRRVTISRTAVWDPLVHRLEPLVCDVCGEPGEGLHLCTTGHLAHRSCLAPQCVECNREYCQLCADQVVACVVCGRPVCRASLRLCPDCERGTCKEHQGLCHAAGGQPMVLEDRKAEPQPEVVAPPPPRKPEVAVRPPAKGAGKATRAVAKPSKPADSRPAPAVTAVRINVEIHEDYPRVVAFVMRSTNLVLAVRTIELTPKGIHVECRCEKEPCPANGWLYRPGSPLAVEEQVKAFLSALRQEYYLLPKRVKYYLVRHEEVEERKTLVLPPMWRDERLLADARREFDERRR
jgi:hypothetical protein